MRVLGAILTIVGAICLVIPSFTFFTRERVADAGFFHIDISKPHTIFLNPGVGIVLLAAGICVFALSPRKVT
jgi:drug/metabolite transporter (DMT)-like permease